MVVFVPDCVELAVIIPVFGHSVLVVDAIRSVLEQETSQSLAIVIVIDGDSRPETLDNVALFSARYANVTSLWRCNGGLSAARNSGIDFALERYPGLASIYFLDADNCLWPRSLTRAYEVLMSHPEADWIYPNLDTMGLASGQDVSGPFSPLLLTRTNYCEAGSLVRADLLRSGLRFDESMRQGYEDWDFWLSAVEQGARGRNEPAFGLRYRKRPESMIANTNRDDAEIRGYLERKHARLYRPRTLLAMEAEEAPRYALIDPASDGATLFTDWREPAATLPAAAFSLQFASNIAAPEWSHTPPFLVFAHAATLHAALDHGILEWCLWEMERRNNGGGLTGVTLVPSDTGSLRLSDGGDLAEADMLMLPREFAIWLIEPERKDDEADALRYEGCRIEALGGGDFQVQQTPSPLEALRANLRSWRGSGRITPVQSPCTWRAPPVHGRRELYRHARPFARTATFPRVPGPASEVGFVVPDCRSIAQLVPIARAFRVEGWRPHLIFMGTSATSAPLDGIETFETVAMLSLPAAVGVNYLGTPLPEWNFHGDHAEAASLLCGLDMVVNCGSLHLHAVAGQLKRWGVSTVNMVAPPKLTGMGRPLGGPYAALAYEHAYDVVVAASPLEGDALVAMGVPTSKLALADTDWVKRYAAAYAYRNPLGA